MYIPMLVDASGEIVGGRPMTTERHLTLTNWGAYEVETDGHDITAVHPFAKDPDPSPIGQSLKAVRQSRITRPSIRESWYRNGPGSNPERRGHEAFVEVEWDVGAIAAISVAHYLGHGPAPKLMIMSGSMNCL